MKCPNCGYDTDQIVYIPEVDMQQEPYKNPPVKTNQTRRESPQDFMQAFIRFISDNPEHKNITPKAFAIIRHDRQRNWERMTK
jgi:hypothetical protein